MTVKAFLTYLQRPWYLYVAFVLIGMSSCNLEPSKSQSLDELNEFFEERCHDLSLIDISRQGTFYEDETGRHRYYRIIGEIDLDEECAVPFRWSRYSKEVEAAELVLTSNVTQITLFLDYGFIDKTWVLEQVLVQSVE